jgi:hypothetical protein
MNHNRLVGSSNPCNAGGLAGIVHANTHNGRLWALYGKEASSFSKEFAQTYPSGGGGTVVLGPLLSTAWNQGYPYNLNTPLWYDGTTTVTGCVATAAAQIMKYWNYPATGQGSTSYTWYNGSTNKTLRANFASSTYDWADMTNTYNGGSYSYQINAVAKLMSDVGIAFHMNYGTVANDGSSASTQYATTVFATYFKYSSSIQEVDRVNYASDSAWMQVFKNEVQNGRPSQFAIYEYDSNNNSIGHSIVIDGNITYLDSEEQNKRK